MLPTNILRLVVIVELFTILNVMPETEIMSMQYIHIITGAERNI